MRVLSLFDGMSCGRIALDRAGIPVTQYLASEVDKYAIKVTMENWPDTIQMGDVRHILPCMIPSDVGLLLAGSPCQGFSMAGKGLNFNDPRSALFFEYVRLLRECLKANPDMKFLFENVRMKQEWRDIITELLGVEPVRINSALVSAHWRIRDYWTNIPVVQPEDKGVVVKDIVEDEVLDTGDQRYLMRLRGRGNNPGGIRGLNGKSPSMTSSAWEQNVKIGLVCVGDAEINGYDSNKRVYSVEGKAPTLLASSGGRKEPKIALDEVTWRKLTPIECERLQTVPDNYTNHVSNTQRYKMLGNGWTVDVIAHILRGISS